MALPFQIEVEFRNVGFGRERKTGVPKGNKKLSHNGARTGTNQKPMPYMAPPWEIRQGRIWRESSALLAGLTVRRWDVFFNVCLHSRSFLLRADWRKSDGPVDREPQGNWRWNWNARDGVASSPSFSRPAARAPWRTCSQATVPPCVVAVLLIPPFNVLFSYFYVSLNLVAGPTVRILTIRDTAPLSTNKGFVNTKVMFWGIVHFTVTSGNKATLPVLLCQSFNLFLC